MSNISSNDGHRSRLRNRFEKSGFSGFNDYEIVELILTLCIPRRDTKEPAKNLLKKYGSLRNILNAPKSELKEIEGIGNITPVALNIIKETTKLYLQQSAEDLPILNNSHKLEDFWQTRLSDLKNEVFEVAYLDNRYRLLRNGVERLHEGTIDHTIVYPRTVITSALKNSASGIVLAHNHPSGKPEPSEGDIHLTKALTQAAKPLAIEVVDHLIFAGNQVFSFRRNGMI